MSYWEPSNNEGAGKVKEWIRAMKWVVNEENNGACDPLHQFT